MPAGALKQAQSAFLARFEVAAATSAASIAVLAALAAFTLRQVGAGSGTDGVKS